MRYKITREMENMILEILVLKQLLENDKISNRKELESNLNRLIKALISEFKRNKTLYNIYYC